MRWQDGGTQLCDASPCLVTGLANATEHRFTVRARNAVGWGPPSAPSAPVVPDEVPGAPVDPRVIDPANRTVTVKSPYTKNSHRVAHYAVVNTAPRPEGFTPDYLTTNGPDLTTPYTEAQREALFSELASGAESGWDYSTRWVKDPYAGNATNTTPKLRTLNVRNTIPVDLNSILCEF